jgi:hypothetical protein
MANGARRRAAGLRDNRQRGAQVSELLQVASIVAIVALMIMDVMLIWQIRKLNRNFALLFGKVDKMFDEIRPLVAALNKATPFLEMVNGISGFFRGFKKE